jgi:hypothetical protein
MMSSSARLVGAFLTLTALATSASAAASVVPLDVQAKLLLKIASYDRNLPASEVVVGVVYPPSDAPGGAAILAAMKDLDVRVGGRNFSSYGIQAGNALEVEAATKDKPVYAVYVTSSVSDTMVGDLRGIAKAKGWLVFAQDPRHVSIGATAAIEQEPQRRAIVLNATAAIEQGRQFDAGFLAVCKIIR